MALIGCLTSTEARRVFLKKDSSSGHMFSNIYCCKYETFKCPEVFNSEPMLIFIHTDQSQNDTTKPDDPIKILSNNQYGTGFKRGKTRESWSRLVLLARPAAKRFSTVTR